MKKVEIFHKDQGYNIGTYTKTNQGVWNRYINGTMIEEVEETVLYNLVFGSNKEQFFYIIDIN